MPHGGIGQKGKIIAPISGHAREKFAIALISEQSEGRAGAQRRCALAFSFQNSALSPWLLAVSSSL